MKVAKSSTDVVEGLDVPAPLPLLDVVDVEGDGCCRGSVFVVEPHKKPPALARAANRNHTNLLDRAACAALILIHTHTHFFSALSS
jgi:hypothetical protein